MRRGILLLVIGMYGCAVQKNASDDSANLEGVVLDFRNCNFGSKEQYIQLNVPAGYRLKKLQEDGFCEYLLLYKDKSVLYVSSNIATGSSLNYQNRLNSGILTYSNNRSKNDTIRNEGIEADSDRWLEWINGSYVIGYINTPDVVKFQKTLTSIALKVDQ